MCNTISQAVQLSRTPPRIFNPLICNDTLFESRSNFRSSLLVVRVDPLSYTVSDWRTDSRLQLTVRPLVNGLGFLRSHGIRPFQYGARCHYLIRVGQSPFALITLSNAIGR
ncbi:unnamed protein product [Nezara viridula]|uniref:Uncharacterized protein n=1 Tax=Nezara viridula TaxID=85310 RepID=A0A9P0HU77_NEZVI|nr:unnamed protein product [Nezara viridula]